MGRYPKSTFKISRTTLTNMIKQWMISRRYWLVYDKKDIITPALFDDYMKDKWTEEYEAVKWCKDNGIVKWSNGRLLPEQPLTREQMCLILYRFANMSKLTPAKWGAPKNLNSEPRP